MRTRRGLRLLLCALALASALRARPALAEAGRTGAQTLAFPLGARASGLGEAFTAVGGGVDSMGYNPAGLSAADRPVLETTYNSGIADDRVSFTAYAHPLPFGVLSAGLLYYDAGAVHLNLSNGTDRVVKAEQDFVGMTGLSIPLPGGLSAGGTAKFYRLELAEAAKASGVAADAGVLWRTPLPGFNLGASLQNMGPDVKFESEADPLPLTARAGASYLLDLERFGVRPDLPYLFTKFQLNADLVRVRDERTSAGVGLEMDLPFGTAGHGLLRFGYLFNRDLDSIAFGIGFKERRFRFDYALGTKRTLSNAHFFTIGCQF